jgi:hypothetical protein
MNKAYPVTGGKELDAYLSAFSKNFQKNAVRSGLRAAANQIAPEIKMRAKGRIASAVTVGSPRDNQDGTFSIRIYVDEKKYHHAFAAYFQEFGVAAHLIASTGKGEGRVAVRKAAEGTGKVKNGVMKIGDRFVSGVIHHPGHAASPFMRPGLDAKARQAIEAFGDQVQEYTYGRTGIMTPYLEVGEAA